MRQKVYAGIGAHLHAVDAAVQDVPGSRPGSVTVCQGPVHHVDGDVVEAVLEASRGLPAHGAATLLLLQAFAFPEGHVLHRGRVVPFGVVCEGGGHGGHSGGGGEGFRAVPPAPLGIRPDDLGPPVRVRGRAGEDESLHPGEGEPLHPSRGAVDPGTFWLLNDGLGWGGGHAKGHLGVIPAVGRAGRTGHPHSCLQVAPLGLAGAGGRAWRERFQGAHRDRARLGGRLRPEVDVHVVGERGAPLPRARAQGGGRAVGGQRGGRIDGGIPEVDVDVLAGALGLGRQRVLVHAGQHRPQGLQREAAGPGRPLAPLAQEALGPAVPQGRRHRVAGGGEGAGGRPARSAHRLLRDRPPRGVHEDVLVAVLRRALALVGAG